MLRYHIKKDGTPSICEAQPGNCPLGDETLHFGSYEEAQRFMDMKNEGLAHKEEYLKEYNELLSSYRSRIQEIQELDQDMTEILDLNIKEERQEDLTDGIRSLKNIKNAVSFLQIPYRIKGEIKFAQFDDPEEFLAFGTEFEREENRELLRNLMKNKIDSQIYGDIEAEIANDTDIWYDRRFYRDPRFAVMLFTIDDLNNIEHYRENPMVAKRDLKSINERIPGYTKYRAYKGFQNRMMDVYESSAKRRIETLIEMRDTKNYDIIREKPALVDTDSRASLEVAANYRKRTFEISKRMEYLRDRLRAIGEDV